jgi:cytochrome P450
MATISPMPPVATGCALPWDADSVDPIADLARARTTWGDTFVVDSGDDRYLFTFTPTGVTSFYALPEERASKGVADWRMLRRKLPDELFAGRRTLPGQLFARDDVASYLTNVDRALAATVEELGADGSFDVFSLTRRIGHRVGLASWGGPGSAEGARFEALVAAFDSLDGSESFVHPDAMAAVAASGKREEYEALAVVEDAMASALSELAGHKDDHPLFTRVAGRWRDESPAVAARGTANDVALIHVASMSNLFAAVGWALVDLLERPDEAARVVSGDDAWAEACALESIRLAQRSIMARFVLEPVVFDVGATSHKVTPGVTIATLLPLTNMSSAPGLDRWDPSRWNRRRLADTSLLDAVELVTAFGHGRHRCPAQSFSLSAMTMTMTRLLGQFSLDPTWSVRPLPVTAQIGGVGRASSPCLVRYSTEGAPGVRVRL